MQAHGQNCNWSTVQRGKEFSKSTSKIFTFTSAPAPPTCIGRSTAPLSSGTTEAASCVSQRSGNTQIHPSSVNIQMNILCRSTNTQPIFPSCLIAESSSLVYESILNPSYIDKQLFLLFCYFK